MTIVGRAWFVALVVSLDRLGLTSRVSIMADFAVPFCFRRKRHAKCIKSREGRFHFVLGHDIFMDRVSSLCSRALVGHLEYCRMGKAT